MQAAVISRIMFGVAFLLTFQLSLLSEQGRHILDRWAGGRNWTDEHLANTTGRGGDTDDPPLVTFVTWILRLVFCLFMIVAFLGYVPLLDLEYNVEETSDTTGRRKLKAVGLLGSIALVAQGLFFLFTAGRGWPWLLFLQPVLIIATARSMEGPKFCSGRQILAATGASFPFVVVGSGFMVCGPDLWRVLAGN